MKTRLFAVVATVILLGGCASTPQYSNIGGKHTSHRHSSSGVSGQTAGAVLGGTAGLAGASLMKAKPEVSLFAVVLGAVAGGLVGKGYDNRAAAIGSTDCDYSANKSGTDRNGNYQQGAVSRKSVPGYKQDCN